MRYDFSLCRSGVLDVRSSSLQSTGQHRGLSADSFHEVQLGLIVRQWYRQQSVNPSHVDSGNNNLLSVY